MELMDLVWYLVIGGVIGWLASILMKTNSQMGLLANVVVGIVGASVGGWLGPKLGLSLTGLGGKIVLGVGGALLVILLLRTLKVLK